MTRARRGFALLTVLWVMVGASLLALAATQTARADVDAARNRADGERAAWRANECLELGRAALDELLGAARSSREAAHAWRDMDHLIANAPSASDDCALVVHAAGARLDLNAVALDQLRALFAALGIAEQHAMADRLMDWRDADDMPREHGAEYDWYVARGRRAPRNGPIADVRELARIAGFETLAGLDSVLGVEPGRVALNSAPLTVLAALPGFTRETVDRIALDRAAGRAIANLQTLAASVSRASADSIVVHFQTLAPLVTVEPDAWILTARGRAGSPPLYAWNEARIARDGRRGTVTRRRSWR